MNERDQILGIVENGQFKRLESGAASGDVLRLTSIQRQEARPPESGELNLTEYEGKAIMVTGHVDSQWVYEAAVIDQAGPILTATVRAHRPVSCRAFDCRKDQRLWLDFDKRVINPEINNVPDREAQHAHH